MTTFQPKIITYTCMYISYFRQLSTVTKGTNNRWLRENINSIQGSDQLCDTDTGIIFQANIPGWVHWDIK